MNEQNKDICVKALEKLSEANSAMISAIETAAKEITGNGKNTILFRSEIDCATCSPLVQLNYNSELKSAYVISDEEDEVSLDDLTANELLEIINHLMAGNYEVYNG